MNALFNLPKTHRLQKRRDFLRVQRYGVRAFGNFVVVISQDSRHGESQFGITVSKKIGSAPERNKIKRRIRQIFRTQKFLYAHKFLVIIAKDSITQASFALLEADIKMALNRLKLKASSRLRRSQNKFFRVGRS